MPFDWTETLYIIIPINRRDGWAALASDVMPDVNEDLTFDSIRLSTDGLEPAVALMAEIPCTKRIAMRWAYVLGYAPPGDYPPLRAKVQTQLDKRVAMVQNSMTHPRFFAAFTGRLSGGKLDKGDKPIRIMDSKFGTFPTIRNIDNVLARRNLQRIIVEDE